MLILNWNTINSTVVIDYTKANISYLFLSLTTKINFDVMINNCSESLILIWPASIIHMSKVAIHDWHMVTYLSMTKCIYHISAWLCINLNIFAYSHTTIYLYMNPSSYSHHHTYIHTHTHTHIYVCVYMCVLSLKKKIKKKTIINIPYKYH